MKRIYKQMLAALKNGQTLYVELVDKEPTYSTSLGEFVKQGRFRVVTAVESKYKPFTHHGRHMRLSCFVKKGIRNPETIIHNMEVYDNDAGLIIKHVRILDTGKALRP